MKKTDLLVIGGSAGGIMAATMARKAYGDVAITLVRQTEKVMVPCGIPYIYGILRDLRKNIIPDSLLSNAAIDLVIDQAVKIDREQRTVTTREGELIGYKKLVLATGSLPLIPTFIPGYDLDNIYPVYKDLDHLTTLFNKLELARDIVVIGGGFIGVEFAEQVRLLGKQVTLIERAESCLWQAFDRSYTDDLESRLTGQGIQVMTGATVKRIIGKQAVEAVELEDGRIIPADLIILGLGVKPYSQLARDCGLALNARGAVIVDQYMRSSDPDIFAVGDCAEKRCYFTGKNVPLLLASTATMEAKIAGSNAFHLRLIRANKGAISTFSTKVFGRTYAAAGLTEVRAREEGFSIMIGEFKTIDRHPATLPGAQEIRIKLIFSRCSGVILGAQVSGGDSVAEMINILSLAIQKDSTASELNTFQGATHPLVSPSPVAYPINAAAMNAIATNCRHLNEDLVL